MTTLFIIMGILLILVIGFVKTFKYDSRLIKSFEFTSVYRHKFIEFSNKYFQTLEKFVRAGSIDNELYVWLTKNSNRMQSNVGNFGLMEYVAPFQQYKVSDYQIILNTIPKFRNGRVEIFDANSVDDCLLRYLGHLEEILKTSNKNLRNPIIWFRIGFQEIFSLPILILNWFGIFSRNSVDKIMGSAIYKIFSGIIGLVTFVSGIVTIVQGKEQTLDLIHKIFSR
jgi:hypothetical protein